MATTINQANFEAAVGECYDAITSESWKSAWLWYARAEAQHSGLSMSSAAGPMAMGRRFALTGLKDALTAAEATASRYSQGSRIGRLGTRHSR